MMQSLIKAIWVLSFCGWGLLVACAQPDNGVDFQVRDLKVGYVCSEPSPEYPALMLPVDICSESKEIVITGQGQCLFGEEWGACTWHGYEFQYDRLNEVVELTCQSKTSEPVSQGSPNVSGSAPVLESDYILRLEAGSQRFFNPQFDLSIRPKSLPSDVFLVTTCFYGSREVLRFNRTIRHPETGSSD